MYFPYLRGRQFELIALRELVEKGLIIDKVVPVIEPIKLSPSLIKTMNKYIDEGREICLIHNPKVGNFKNDFTKENQRVKTYINLLKYNLIRKTHILNSDSQTEVDELKEMDVNMNEVGIIIRNRDDVDLYDKLFSNFVPFYGFGPDDRKIRRTIEAKRVLLEDKFNKLSRNADYKDIDEFFSDDHKFYIKENCIGFSDYSIVGDEFIESGFAPYSVAIHVVYFDKNYDLRVIHFVSDSNSDFKDPGGKFYEAVTKLYEWQKDKDVNTFGMREFIRHYNEGSYPGLGTVKKLSIMHHIELVSQYLSRT